ncbi:MAG: TerB family tellurite resistance protein, partial [Waterburya sp.]
QFLADIIIASLPMLKADGIVDENEKLAIKQLLANPQINQKDRERVEVAINSNDSFDDLINKNLLYDKKQEKVALKRKLLLSITWEIAKADGKIDEREIELHDRMAKILQIDQEAVLEIRRIITPTFKQLSPSKSESSFFKFFKFGHEKKSQSVTIDVLAEIV